MSQKNEVVKMDPQIKKIKEYSVKIGLLKPIVGSDEPEGKINKSPENLSGE